MKLKIFAFILALMFFVLPSAVLAADSYTYEWTKTFAGSGYDYGYSVISDASGNLFVASAFTSTVDFDPGAGVDSHTSIGDYDGYLTKYNVDGTYAWTKTFGGTGFEDVGKVIVDKSNNIYIVGEYSSPTDFDSSSGVDIHTLTGSFNGYVSKYNSDGSYGWTKTYGGNSLVYASSANFDKTGNLYVIGIFDGTADFDPGIGTSNFTSNGDHDTYISKFTADGNYLWTKTVGSTGVDRGSVIISNSDTDFISAGFYAGTADFDPGPGVDNHTSVGGYDIFISKYTIDGSYVWTKTFGGPGDELWPDITRDNDGNLYLFAKYFGTVDFDPGVGVDSHSSYGNSDVFISKYSADDSYLWTKTFGGSASEYTGGIITDHSGNIYLTGMFGSTADFDPGAGVVERTETGSYGSSAFIASYNTSGEFRWVHTLDSDDGSDGYGITYDSFSNSVYATGDFGVTTDFNPLGGHDIVTTDANWSGWIMKLSHVAPLPVLETNSSPGNDPEQAQIPFSDKGNVVGGSLSPVKDSDTGEQKVTVQIEPETLKFNAFLSSVKQSPSDLLSSLTSPINSKTTSLKSNTILTGGNSLGIKTSGGTAWQVGSIQKIFYKAYPPTNSGKESAVITSSLQSKPSIISLTYKDLDLVPNGDSKHPFKPTSLKLAYSPDGVTWSIMKSSVVDPTNKTVSAIDKLGGYYMIVSGGSTSSLSPSKSSSKVLGASTTAKSKTQTDKVITPSTLITPTEATPSPLPTYQPTTKPIQIPKPKTCVLWWCW